MVERDPRAPLTRVVVATVLTVPGHRRCQRNGAVSCGPVRTPCPRRADVRFGRPDRATSCGQPGQCATTSSSTAVAPVAPRRPRRGRARRAVPRCAVAATTAIDGADEVAGVAGVVEQTRSRGCARRRAHHRRAARRRGRRWPRPRAGRGSRSRARRGGPARRAWPSRSRGRRGSAPVTLALGRRRSQPLPLRAVADDDRPDAGHRRELGQAAYAVPLVEPPDVADDDLRARRGRGRATRSRAASGRAGRG